MAAAFENALVVLRRARRKIIPLDIAETLAKLSEANKDLILYEGARANEQRFKEFGSRLDPHTIELVRTGLHMPVERYDNARRLIDEQKQKFAQLFETTPIILTPAAPGPAPLGLASTGNPRMNAPWTALGTPAISIPMPVSTALPLGLQLTAQVGHDATTLHTALHLHETLTATFSPRSPA
jgi:Asp-tRNA(Asn)/Glu-tRNA(Gln) amidotransferase A subunit family amidase